MTEAITKQSPWNKGLKTGPLTEKHRNHISEALQGHSVSEETRKKISLAQCGEKNHMYGKTGEKNPFYGRKHTKESLKKNTEAHRGRNPWNQGKVNIYSEETLKKMSLAKLGKPLLEETKRKMSESRRGAGNALFGKFGAAHPSWQGGRSFEPYCTKFNGPLKEDYRNAYGRICVYCGKSEIFNWGLLCVHHVDGNKMQGCDETDWFLVPLCKSCNSKGFERKPEFVFLFWLKDIERKHRGSMIRK